MSKPFFPEIVARKKLGKGDEWKFCIVERITGGIIVKGGPTTTYKSGKKVGRNKWGPKESLDVVLVSDSDCWQAEKEYETATGKCHLCGGNGKRTFSVSVVHGTKYRDCERCKGSGLAQAEQ